MVSNKLATVKLPRKEDPPPRSRATCACILRAFFPLTEIININ